MATITLSNRLDPVLPNGSFRLRVWVSACDTGIDPNIFVYQRKPSVPEEEYIVPPLGFIEEFVCVAAMADLTEYPMNTPGDGPFYRLSYFDMELDDVQRLGRTWDGLLGDTRDLMRNLAHYVDPRFATITEKSI